MFPRDISHPPREFAERFFDVVRFTKPERGGHFAALEVPELMASDLIAFRDALAQQAAADTPRGAAAG